MGEVQWLPPCPLHILFCCLMHSFPSPVLTAGRCPVTHSVSANYSLVSRLALRVLFESCVSKLDSMITPHPPLACGFVQQSSPLAT